MYDDVVYILKNLQVPPRIYKTLVRFLRLKYVKYFLLNGYLYWKDPQGILLNFLLEYEAKKMIKEFHEGECGGHIYWKATTNKILRVGFYWPTFFLMLERM